MIAQLLRSYSMTVHAGTLEPHSLLIRLVPGGSDQLRMVNRRALRKQMFHAARENPMICDGIVLHRMQAPV